MSKTKTVQDIVTQQTWVVRLIRKGDAYGLNDKLTHDQARPMVDFFRCEQGNEDKGFFVSRYYVETLLAGSHKSIQLDGRDPAFAVHEQAFADVLQWLREECPEVVRQLANQANNLDPLELVCRTAALKESTMLTAIECSGLVINAPHFFKDPAFAAWLNNQDPKFTWHKPGDEPHEWSDVVVLVNPSLNGEGNGSDMPEHCWEEIIQTCKLRLINLRTSMHIMVRLTNLEE